MERSAWKKRVVLPEFMRQDQVGATEHLSGLSYQKKVLPFGKLNNTVIPAFEHLLCSGWDLLRTGNTEVIKSMGSRQVAVKT